MLSKYKRLSTNAVLPEVMFWLGVSRVVPANCTVVSMLLSGTTLPVQLAAVVQLLSVPAPFQA